MPKTKDCREPDYSKYDTMSTRQLQQILQEDASKSEGEDSDTAMVLYVMEVLARREKGERKTPREALRSFKELYDTENFFNSRNGKPEYKTPQKPIWKRFAAVAAVVAFVLVGGVFTAYAFGVDVFGVVANWTEDIFYFEPPECQQGPFPKTQYISNHDLRDTLDQLGLQDIAVPTWLPEGYEEVKVEIDQADTFRNIIALYDGPGGMIQISVCYIPSSVLFERDPEPIEVCRIGENTYYIFSNLDHTVAAWVSGSYQCGISGPVSYEEMKKIVNSIK